MSFPANRKYVASHEWARAEGDLVVVGITDHAQSSLGDIVHVDLPAVGAAAEAGASIAEIESVKAVSDIYAPIGGEVVEVNGALEDAPETVNEDPHGGGWLFKIRPSDPAALDGLMDAAAYAASLA